MTSRQHWPKPDLLQQRRLELGLPLEPAPAPPLFSLVIKGSIGALVLVMLAWLVVEEKSFRLVLFRQRVPEVDHALEAHDPLACQREIRACVAAWQARAVMASALGWWFSVPTEQVDDWRPLVDGAVGECCLNQPLPIWAEPSDQADAVEVPSALQQLALLALHQEER